MRRLIPFLLALLLIAALLRIEFFFTILYLFFAVYLLSRLWMQQAVKQLRAERRFTNRAFLGEAVEVQLRIENAGWLPVPWVEVCDTFPVELRAPSFFRQVLPLGAHEQRTFRYTLDCRKRGYYKIGPLQLKTGDLLDAATAEDVVIAPEHLIVYPQVLPLDKLGLPTHSPLVALPAQARIFEDPARIMGVRDYHAGDSLRRIHWTASASAGRLLVKQYQPSIARETLICLDLDPDNYELRRRYTAPELAIVAAASLASHITERERLPVGLATQAFDPLADAPVTFSLPPRRERAHLMGILETLARVQLAEKQPPFPDFLRRQSVARAWGTTIVVISGSASASLFDTLIYLKRSGFAVALLLAQPRRLPEELEGMAGLVGIPIYPLWNPGDVGAIQ